MLRERSRVTEESQYELEKMFANVDRIDADTILKLLDGLPLALTQAGSYMRETNMSASSYAKHYDTTWKQLM